MIAALEERLTSLAEKWHGQLRAYLEIRPESVFPGDDLLDHMPAVIAWVIESVEEVEEVDPSSVAFVQNTARHWREVGLSVEESLMHLRVLSRLLHREVHEIFQEMSPDPDLATASLISERLSHAIMLLQAVLVATYRDEQESRLEDLSGMIVHQIRDPLGAALTGVGTLDMLEEGPDRARVEERRRSLVERIGHSLRHATRMVESVQHLVRNATTSIPETEAEPLPSVISEVLEELRNDAGAVEVRRDDPIPDILVPGDPVRLALHNLVQNAIRYSDPEEPSSCVRVSCRREDGDGRWLLHVEDNGPGIPEAEQEEIFGRFRRGRGASGDGFGLGLSIVRQAAAQIGGDVTVESTPGSGSTFTFAIPAERTSATPDSE